MARLIDTMDEKQMWKSWVNTRLPLKQWCKELCKPLVLEANCATSISYQSPPVTNGAVKGEAK